MPVVGTEFDDETRALLSGRSVAQVVTLRADGRPRVVVTWVGADAECVLLNAHSHRLWVADLRRDPAVVVTVVDRDDPYRYVTVEGEVQHWMEGSEAAAAYHALAVRYWGRAGADAHLPGGDRVHLRIAPRKVRRYFAPHPAEIAPPTD